MEILKHWYRVFRIAWMALAGLCLASPSLAEEPREYKIEAAYLYNFFNYVTWPGYGSPQELHETTICLYGNDPIVPYLNYVQHKMSGERELKVSVIDEGSPTKGCNILFLRKLLPRDEEQSVAGDTLVVLASTDSLDQGGMIELLQENERVLIKIHQASLSANGFKISSRLLDLAEK